MQTKILFIEFISKVTFLTLLECYSNSNKGKKSSLTRHADAAEGSRVVETGAIVLTGMGFALVHVRFASRPRESLRTVAGERAGRVHANTVVLARGSCNERNKEKNIFFFLPTRKLREANGFARRVDN